jgi:hypothetical protein
MSSIDVIVVPPPLQIDPVSQVPTVKFFCKLEESIVYCPMKKG